MSMMAHQHYMSGGFMHPSSSVPLPLTPPGHSLASMAGGAGQPSGLDMSVRRDSGEQPQPQPQQQPDQQGERDQLVSYHPGRRVCFTPL